LDIYYDNDDDDEVEEKEDEYDIFSPLAVQIPRAENMKSISTVRMARSPVLHRQKQSSRVLRLN